MDCTGINTSASAHLMHVLQNEGTYYAAENFSMENVKAYDCSLGWQVIAAQAYEPGRRRGRVRSSTPVLTGVR